MRSKVHRALTAPLVLHHTRIYKCAMKKFGFNSKMRNEPFFIVIYHSSLVKGAMNAAQVCKLRNGVKKCLDFCRGWALSTLISPLRYLDLHFHNQTTGTRRTTWTANHLFSFTFANITGPQNFHMVALRPHSDDGSKLNTIAFDKFYIIIISYISPFKQIHVML